jgi:sortase A
VRVLRILEVFFLTVAVASIGWYATVHILSAREQAALSEELDHLVAPSTRIKAGPRELAELGQTSTTTTTSTTTAATKTSRKGAASARGLVGRIEVPRLKLSVLAREGIDDKTLRVAAGHIPGTALPGEAGNAGFAAHRDTFFRPLKSVREGDEVVVTTPRGVHRYAVTDIRIVEPADVSVLNPTTDAILTLVTCYPFEFIGDAPQRFIVRAALRGR